MSEPAASESALRVYVTETGARCPRCAYSLSGLKNDQCPECGKTLRLAIGMAPRDWTWHYGLLGLILGELLLVIVLISITANVVLGSWHREPVVAVISGIVILACAWQSFALARWIVRRGGVAPLHAALAWGTTAALLGVLWLAAYVLSVL